MRNRTSSFRSVVPIALVVLLASITSAGAGQDVIVKVPFAFQVGETYFNPGEYVLSMDRISPGSVLIQSADHRNKAIVLARKSVGDAKGEPSISFRAYGDSRFLSAIQVQDGARERWEIVPSVGEAAVARAAGGPQLVSLRIETVRNKQN